VELVDSRQLPVISILFFVEIQHAVSLLFFSYQVQQLLNDFLKYNLSALLLLKKCLFCIYRINKLDRI